MNRLTYCAIVVLLTVPVQSTEPVDSGAISKIRAEGLERSQAPQVFHLLVDDIGPRLAGSPQHKRAAEWTRDQLTKYGLSNARLEAFEFGRGWVLDKLTVEMIEPRYMPLIGYAEAWTPSTTGEVIAPVVVVAGKTAQDIAAMPIKGAAIMQSAAVTNFIATDRAVPVDAPAATPTAAAGRSGAPAIGQAATAAQTGGRAGGAPGGRQGGASVTQTLQSGGAAILLKPSRGLHGTVFVQVGRDNPSNTLPSIVLAGEHYNMVLRLAQTGTPVKLRVNVQTRFLDQDRNSYNVIAELPGTDPALRDQVVMLGAHLDSNHTGTGATDNADGVAAVMEALRILKAAGLQNKRTIRIALWAAEEEGLLGSKAWVKAHLTPDPAKSSAPKDRVSIYFNIDPGKGPITGWYLENNDAARPIFDAWMAPLKDLGATGNVRQGIGNTDHLSFIEAGVPGFNVIQSYVEYDVREHHTNMDTAERVNDNDLKQNAVVLASMIYHAANRRDPVPSPVRK